MATISDLPELTAMPDPTDLIVVRRPVGSDKDRKMLWSRFYEDGEWSPTIYGSTTPGSPTFTVATTYCRYARAGRLCSVGLYITLSNKGTMAGNVRIGGLPFTAWNVRSFPLWWPVNLASGITVMGGEVIANQNHFGLLRTTGNVVSGNTAMPVSDLANNTILQISFAYLCNP